MFAEYLCFLYLRGGPAPSQNWSLGAGPAVILLSDGLSLEGPQQGPGSIQPASKIFHPRPGT
jgi:hypothetical protein